MWVAWGPARPATDRMNQHDISDNDRHGTT